MPHFTVTKVEDPEEGAGGPVFPEPSSAEVKAWIQDPQEPGESRACSFGDPQTSFCEGSDLAISLFELLLTVRMEGKRVFQLLYYPYI